MGFNIKKTSNCPLLGAFGHGVASLDFTVLISFINKFNTQQNWKNLINKNLKQFSPTPPPCDPGWPNVKQNNGEIIWPQSTWISKINNYAASFREFSIYIDKGKLNGQVAM